MVNSHNHNPQLSFFDHLEELRQRLIRSLLALCLGCFIAYPFIDSILTIIIQPIGSLIFTHPAGAFSARVNLTLLAGFFLALPFILYQIWMFVSIGLTLKEIRFIKIFIPVSFLLFSLGSVFAYLIASSRSAVSPL